MYPKEECVHITSVLEQTKNALVMKDVIKLKDLSNQTIHSACAQQDSASITIAVIIYSISKLIERDDYMKIEKWDSLIKTFNYTLDNAIRELKNENYSNYQKQIQKAREVLESASINLKPYIQDVLKKAAINKASRIYEHGISIEQTAKILGITIWELSDYIGQKSPSEKETKTMDTKKRARMAMEFFS